MRKIRYYPILVVVVVILIGAICYGALLKHHYMGGGKFKYFRNVAVFLAEIPFNLKYIINNSTIDGNVVEPINDNIYSEKKIFDKKIKNFTREELVLVSRYDGDLKRSIVEIRDINTFEILHSYLPNIKEIYERTDLKKVDFLNLEKNIRTNRFLIYHPEITNKGELIFHGQSPLVKINYESEIIWINQEDLYHHSINTDLEENIYVPSHKYPFSKMIDKYVGVNSEISDQNNVFKDDTINILDKNGKIIYSKSVSEILIENGMIGRIFANGYFIADPIHLNDIEPVLYDTPYFKKGDLFLSLRNINMIILYRPSNNKIIKVLEGNFLQQHDVDIIDQKSISIYNNNILYDHKGEANVDFNEIVIYNFETQSYSTKFQNTLKENKINTVSAGLIDFLADGSAIIEDNNNGKIYYLNDNGEVIWEFMNLNSKNRVYPVVWARLIDLEKSNKIRNLIKEKNE